MKPKHRECTGAVNFKDVISCLVVLWEASYAAAKTRSSDRSSLTGAHGTMML